MITIPYDSVDELPKQVKDNLPVSGQELWMKAYNYASNDTKRFKTEADRARYAWGVVKKVFEKADSKWVKKNSKSNASSIAEVASDIIIISEEIIRGFEDNTRKEVQHFK